MLKLRARFEKTGKVIYISHLDLMRLMQRAFIRAGVAIEYSKGFNPHPVMSIALPLSVGCASFCELMDFRLEDAADSEGLAEKLSSVTPEGISVTEVYEPVRKISGLKWIRVTGRLDYDGRDAGDIVPGLRDFYARSEMKILRHTKRGESEIDLSEHVRMNSVSGSERGVLIDACISAQEPTVNPALLISALEQLEPGLAPDFASFARMETYDAEMNIFR